MLPTDSDFAKLLTPFGKWLYARLITVGVIIIIALTLFLFLAFEGKAIREWLSALSGWIAAVAAFGIGIPSLRKLQQQNELTAKEGQINALFHLSAQIEQGNIAFAENSFRSSYQIADDIKPLVAKTLRMANTLKIFRESFAHLPRVDYDTIYADISIQTTYNQSHIDVTGDLGILNDVAQVQAIADIAELKIASSLSNYLESISSEISEIRDWKKQNFLK